MTHHTPFISPDWPAPANVLALSSLRTGGLSQPPYDSLNLAMHVGDNVALVDRNRLVLADALPAGSHVQWLSQEHGGVAVQACTDGSHPRADASWCRSVGLACAVMTADCLPVLFCSADGACVAAAHAGWRGLLDGVLRRTVEAMCCAPTQLLAWLGPAIGPAAFEVGAEVRAAFLESGESGAQVARLARCFNPVGAGSGRYMADIYALARVQLHEAGVVQVFGGNFCTFSDSARFFSYRRDGVTGRMVSLIMKTQ